MNISNLFFHIHYCNMKQFNKSLKYKFKNTRTLKHHEVGLIIGAKGNIRIENKKHKINEGILFYISPDVTYFIELDIEKAAYFMTVHFSYANVIFNDSIWNIKNESEILPLHPVQELKDYCHIGEIFKKLVSNWYEKLPNYEFVTKNLLEQLIFEVSESIKEQRHNYLTDLKIEKVIKYMNQNVNKKITVAELSQLVRLSLTYLSEAFKDATGYSIIKFFNKMKIDKAKELIIEGDKKIKEVAGLLGFSDEFYFSRMFKNIEGISPSEFYSRNVYEY
ncbi:AraC family transcriptional regulator [Clostridium saccharoperbutylacetonicum]|uniref:AraC family transcriptional regulator n=1 Tax=Clostridium saccharoperbutylacetonicum TaxID=36745 RepID=UPI0039E9CACC